MQLCALTDAGLSLRGRVRHKFDLCCLMAKELIAFEK